MGARITALAFTQPEYESLLKSTGHSSSDAVSGFITWATVYSLLHFDQLSHSLSLFSKMVKLQMCVVELTSHYICLLYSTICTIYLTLDQV